MQSLPGISCGATMVTVCYILYPLPAPQGIQINTLSPQGVIIVLCAAGTAVCLYTCLAGPFVIRKLGYAKRPEAQNRRMNLLGLVSCWLCLPVPVDV